MNGISVGEKNTELRAVQVNDDLFERWKLYLDVAPASAITYAKSIRNFARYLSDNNIDKPTREDIIKYKNHIKEAYQASTAQGYLAAVKLFFKWTAVEGLYPNIADHIKGVSTDEGYQKGYLTSRQAGRLLSSVDRSTVKGKRDYAIMALMLTTGLRTISVARANTEDIRTVGDCAVLFYKGKGRSSRNEYVKLSGPTEKAIRDYFQARGDVPQQAPLFASLANRNSGGRMTTRSISRIVKDHLISIGMKNDRLTAHSLRHTAATLNLLNGGSLDETQQMLGHKSISTTMIYSHALDRERNNSEDRISAAIFGDK